MKRLLIVASEYPPMKAGVANLCLSVYSVFRERGEDVCLLVPEGSEIAEPERQFPLLKRSKGSFQWPVNLVNSLVLRTLSRRQGIGHILFLDASARCQAFPWSPKVGHSVYLNGTELVKRSPLGELMSGRFLLQSRAIRSADSILCISEATRVLFRKVFPDLTATVIYPAFDPRRVRRTGTPSRNPYPEESGGKLVFLTVSRIVHRKGHDQVLRILALLKPRLPPFHYYVVGQGPEEANLRALADRLGLANEVTWAGAVADEALGDYYRHADIFIMLSRKSGDGIEGFGLTFVEANASGTVSVGSDHGGCVEAVKDGVSGITVSGDDLEGTAERILALALDGPLRKRLSEEGEKWVWENFSGERMYLAFKSVLPGK